MHWPADMQSELEGSHLPDMACSLMCMSGKRADDKVHFQRHRLKASKAPQLAQWSVACKVCSGDHDELSQGTAFLLLAQTAVPNRTAVCCFILGDKCKCQASYTTVKAGCMAPLTALQPRIVSLVPLSKLNRHKLSFCAGGLLM